MLTAVELKPNVYWVGAIDWNARSFHGYTTEDGITYNAYLIIDEKITLIDTVKAPFANEMLERISSVCDPADIDVIVANHVEMDHSGALPIIHALAPDAPIYCSAPKGVQGFTAHYGDLGYTGVKKGDTINIGSPFLFAFVPTPMVHWPDNMVTYCPQDKILFSNDAFGQHFSSSARFDDQNDIHEVFKQARKYYANIVQPYRMQASNAVKAVRSLGPDAIDLIAPAHGIVWRTYVGEIIDMYEQVTSGKLQEKALVVYDTMWHSTAMIANAIADAFLAENVPCQLMDLKDNHVSDAMDVFMDCKYVAVGSPTLNSNMLPTVAQFLVYMRGLAPKNQDRIGLAFGSYGWAPLGPKQVAEQLAATGFNMPIDTFAYNWIPDDAFLADVREKVRALVRGE